MAEAAFRSRPARATKALLGGGRHETLERRSAQQVDRDRARLLGRGQLQPRPTQRSVVQRVPAEVGTILHQTAAAEPALGLAPLVVHTVSVGLEEQGVGHRFGGSLAARLQGAGRAPADLDVEVQNGDDVARAGNALVHLTGRVATYGQSQAQVAAQPRSFVPNLHAGVAMRFTNPQGEARDIDVDISNENAPEFVAGTRSPQQRGVQPGMGSLVSRPELIMNYIRRILTRPDRALAKGDRGQVAQLLVSVGFNPGDAAHVAELRQVVEATFNAENVPLALGVLEQIINNAG